MTAGAVDGRTWRHRESLSREGEQMLHARMVGIRGKGISGDCRDAGKDRLLSIAAGYLL